LWHSSTIALQKAHFQRSWIIFGRRRKLKELKFDAHLRIFSYSCLLILGEVELDQFCVSRWHSLFKCKLLLINEFYVFICLLFLQFSFKCTLIDREFKTFFASCHARIGDVQEYIYLVVLALVINWL